MRSGFLTSPRATGLLSTLLAFQAIVTDFYQVFCTTQYELPAFHPLRSFLAAWPPNKWHIF